MQRHGPPDWLLDALDPLRIGRFLVRSRVRAVLAWAAVFVAAVVAFGLAWTTYDQPGRPERTAGHVYIDFSGQWLMAHMLVRGDGPHLYDREHVHKALLEGYGPTDGETVFGWIIEVDGRPEVGGALYPPVHALLFAPLGLMPPLAAYRTVQVVNFLLTFVIGFLVWKLTRGRVWAAVATGAVMVFPGYNGAISLGQNPLMSLALLVLGWLLLARGRPWLGGAAWGLLAFKPVWAASFLLVPLLARRWRFAAAMMLTGLALVLATLPLVGVRAWLDWLAVGRAASQGYTQFENWIFLSRDLENIPRRWMLTFVDGWSVNADPALRARNVAPDTTLPDALGLALWLAVAGLTVALAAWRWRRPAGLDGPSAAFLGLGAFLSCFHFMYYDVLLAALPVCLLFTDPAQYLRPAYVVPPGPRGGWLWNSAAATLTALLFLLPHLTDALDYLLPGRRISFYAPPFDTFCLLALWGWCGWLSRKDEG